MICFFVRNKGCVCHQLRPCSPPTAALAPQGHRILFRRGASVSRSCKEKTSSSNLLRNESQRDEWGLPSHLLSASAKEGAKMLRSSPHHLHDPHADARYQSHRQQSPEHCRTDSNPTNKKTQLALAHLRLQISGTLTCWFVCTHAKLPQASKVAPNKHPWLHASVWLGALGPSKHFAR